MIQGAPTETILLSPQFMIYYAPIKFLGYFLNFILNSIIHIPTTKTLNRQYVLLKTPKKDNISDTHSTHDSL